MQNKKPYLDAYAENDPRSVAAMLRGKGDGREMLFTLYEMGTRLSHTPPGDDEIHAAYHYFVQRHSTFKQPYLLRVLYIGVVLAAEAVFGGFIQHLVFS